jgi:hypothetical protein
VRASWLGRVGLGDGDPPRLVGRVWGATGEPGRPLGVAVMPLSADAGLRGRPLSLRIVSWGGLVTAPPITS